MDGKRGVSYKRAQGETGNEWSAKNNSPPYGNRQGKAKGKERHTSGTAGRGGGGGRISGLHPDQGGPPNQGVQTGLSENQCSRSPPKGYC